MSEPDQGMTYGASGVDTDEAGRALKGLAACVTETHRFRDQAGVGKPLRGLGYYANPYVFGALTQGWNEPPIGAEYANGATPAYMHFRKTSIYSGSNEIQHNIIAKAQLGL